MAIPTRRVNGLHSNAVDSEVLRHVTEMIPDWNFEIHGDHGSTIQVHLWKDGHDKTKNVYPSDYVNDPDPWARINPTAAAVTEGIQRIMCDLELGE